MVVVVHVHVRVLERAVRPGSRRAPSSPPPPRSGCAPTAARTSSRRSRPLDPAEQEEQPDVSTPERMSLEVEEDVAVIGCRKRREPDEFRVRPVGCWIDNRLRRDLEELEGRRIVQVHSSLDLEARLADEPVATVIVETFDRTIERGQAGDRRYMVGVQGVAVGLVDTGDMDERIGPTPLLVAHELELAEFAVIARLGNRGLGTRRRSSRRRAAPAGAASRAGRRRPGSGRPCPTPERCGHALARRPSGRGPPRHRSTAGARVRASPRCGRAWRRPVRSWRRLFRDRRCARGSRRHHGCRRVRTASGRSRRDRRPSDCRPAPPTRRTTRGAPCPAAAPRTPTCLSAS